MPGQRPSKPSLEPDDKLQGVRMLERLQPLLARLRSAGCQRDRAGNRQLFYDEVCSLILLTFFNPILKSLRDLQKASGLKQVRQKLGVSETSLGSLSEALRVFDPQLLVEIIQELLWQLPDSPTADPRLKNLAHVPTAVDGSLLRALPQITQAAFATRKDRGWKLHAQFEVLRGVPTAMHVTDASGKQAASEAAVLASKLKAERCYIVDRGYEKFALFNAIAAAGSSYVARVRNDHVLTVTEERALSPEAVEAGVLKDSLGQMGSPKSQRIEHPDHLQRQVQIRVPIHAKRLKRGGRRRQAASQDIVLVTNLLDVPAEILVLLYRFRWLIELFFRWLKCVLGCRHLVSASPAGIQIQMYCAWIACLLIQLATGQNLKPKQWTYKLFCLYFNGLADEDDLLAHFQELAAAAAKNAS